METGDHSKNWYNNYSHFLNNYFEDMPTGWYKTEDTNLKAIIEKSIKI